MSDTHPHNPDGLGPPGVRLSAAAAGATRYAPPTAGGPIDLWLDANEGPAARLDLGELLARLGPGKARRYPDAAPLERQLADRFYVDASRVLVTAGGDEAIDRACRACLEPGREIVLPMPTFEMIGRYARLAGATLCSPPWPCGPYPIEAVLGAINERTAMIAVVSPNNPTGEVATAQDLERLAAAAPGALLLIDLAYAEFADEDLTKAALALPNAVVIRTFSKAMGLAGLRVGFAIGPARIISAMRAVGGPYPVASLSLAAAAEALRRADVDVPETVARVRVERESLFDLLRGLGARPLPSQANFILAEFKDAAWVWRGLASLGIAVRRFGSGSGLENMLRITCPGQEASFDRLCRALRTVMRPKALLFDMDGVLVDVSGSYRRAILLTAEAFGVRLTPEIIAAAKAAGDANNDWVLTHRLIAGAGISASLEDVTARFEAIYQGTAARPGLEATERLIPSRALLERLSKRLPLGIVTGRPRRDCERALSRFGVADLFRSVVCMEDGPAKPDPAVVHLALDRLRITEAWMVGDTPDDINAARSAQVVPIGFIAPGDDPARASDVLNRTGAAAIVDALETLERMLT